MSRASLILPLICLAMSGCKTNNAPKQFEFTRLVAHWANYAHEDYLPFIEDAQPEIAQVGFYGAHFWSLSHTPFYKGYPAHFPVQGLDECGDWFQNLNKELHQREVKVVGHMNLKFLVGDPDGEKGPRGFFKFYRELWDESELGPRPVDDPLELLEKNADGSPRTNNNYSIGKMKEYWGCLNNPHWRAVLKAWTRRGIERGVDGFQINYFYRHNCLCNYCVTSFKDYLRGRFDEEQLNAFGIKSLDTHQFSEIVCWHKPEESTPLRREMLRFSQISNKQAFDEVFVDYGRSLKPDLLVSQWNHIGNFRQIYSDERCMLPADLWGKGEDYLWYSSGGSAHFTDLAENYLGEVTLTARYVRSAFNDKPYTFGKYESTRIRVAIAELLANGGAPMGFYTRFTDPLARAEIVRYYQFIKRNESLFKGNHPYAEAALIFPRRQIQNGKFDVLERFKTDGETLLNRHVLFDVIPDDMASAERMARYIEVFGADDATDVVSTALPSVIEAPGTVRVSASVPARGGELDLHFVNYNRTEPAAKRSAGAGIKDEKPISVSGIKVALALPPEANVRRVCFLTPEAKEERPVPFQVSDGILRFEVPEFLVYGVVRVARIPKFPPSR